MNATVARNPLVRESQIEPEGETWILLSWMMEEKMTTKGWKDRGGTATRKSHDQIQQKG
jgi:hypothetical protein